MNFEIFIDPMFLNNPKHKKDSCIIWTKIGWLRLHLYSI